MIEVYHSKGEKMDEPSKDEEIVSREVQEFDVESYVKVSVRLDLFNSEWRPLGYSTQTKSENVGNTSGVFYWKHATEILNPKGRVVASANSFSSGDATEFSYGIGETRSLGRALRIFGVSPGSPIATKEDMALVKRKPPSRRRSKVKPKKKTVNESLKMLHLTVAPDSLYYVVIKKDIPTDRVKNALKKLGFVEQENGDFKLKKEEV